MTAMLPLSIRLRIVRLALAVPPERESEAPALARSGAGLLVLSQGDRSAQQAAQGFENVRRELPMGQALLATDSLEVGRRVGADLVYLADPHRCSGSLGLPHPHTLMGRFASPEGLAGLGKYSFALVGPATRGDIVSRAASVQPPWSASSAVWFAAGGVDVGNIETVLAAGARRVAISTEVMNASDPALACRSVAEALTQAWDCDQARAYIDYAFR